MFDSPAPECKLLKGKDQILVNFIFPVLRLSSYSINILKLNELMDLLWSFSSELVEFWQLYTLLNCKDDLCWLDPKFAWILPAQVNDLYLFLRFSGMILPQGTWLSGFCGFGFITWRLSSHKHIFPKSKVIVLPIDLENCYILWTLLNIIPNIFVYKMIAISLSKITFLLLPHSLPNFHLDLQIKKETHTHKSNSEKAYNFETLCCIPPHS